MILLTKAGKIRMYCITESQSGQDKTIARIFPNDGGGHFIELDENVPVYI